MNKKIYFILLALLGWSFGLKAQTATLPSITATPGDPVSFAVEVDGLNTDIGAISLFIGYDANVLQFTGTTSGTISGYIENNMTMTNQVGIQWTTSNLLTGEDVNGTLLTLNFIYKPLGGVCDVTFDAGCEFSRINLSSEPVIYTDGDISPDPGVATITIGDSVLSEATVATGNFSMNVDAAGFGTNVGAITLYIEYNDGIMDFAGVTTSLTGLLANASGGQIAISWYSIGGDDINGTPIVLNFNNYNGAPGEFVFTGLCEIAYTDLTAEVVSYDNGSVTGEAFTRMLSLPDDFIASPNNTISIPITASGYDANVAAMDIVVDFDAACLTFTGVTPGTITPQAVNTSVPGMAAFSWTDPSLTGVDIDGVLLYLNFTYHFGDCDLDFRLSNCHVDDIGLNMIPTTYDNGNVVQNVGGPEASLPTLAGQPGTMTFPITVRNFSTDVGAISLFIGFDDNVLTFTGTTPGTIYGFYANYIPSTSQVGIQWADFNGVDIDGLDGEDTLLYLNFTYNTGVCDLTFDLGCEFADPTTAVIPVGFYNGGITLGFKVDIKVFLEGPFNGTDMNTGLNNNGYLPLSSPYGSGESLGAIPSADIVDWVSVELRETAGGPASADGSTTVATVDGFLLKTGEIKSIADVSDMLFFPFSLTDDLYVVVRHRNHLAVMSANPLSQSFVSGFEVYSYDFTDAQSKAYNNGQKALTGAAAMVAGDENADGIVDITDYFPGWYNQFGFNGYNSADFNMDGIVDITDYFPVWYNNFGQSSQVP